MKKIDHVGVAVKSIEEALRLYVGILGLKLEAVEALADRNLKVAFLEAGGSHIELLEPTSPESAVARFIETRGEGIHHLALRVEGIERELESARRAGLRLIDEIPRPGAQGARIAFIHPKGTGGVLLELCERKGGREVKPDGH